MPGTYAARGYIFVISDISRPRMARKIDNFPIYPSFLKCLAIGFMVFATYRIPSFRRCAWLINKNDDGLLLAETSLLRSSRKQEGGNIPRNRRNLLF